MLSDKVVINDYSKSKDLQTLQAEDLVKHFHQTFHGVSAHTPQSKETDQALDLVSRYGLEKSQRIVDFVREQAASTNYRIQHFGAVLSYTSRALAEIDRQDHQAAAKPVSPAVVQAPRPQYSRGESRIASLTKEQYDLRFEGTRIALLRENKFLANRKDQVGSILFQMVRAKMIRDLDQEPMELLPLNSMPEWLRHLAQNLPL